MATSHDLLSRIGAKNYKTLSRWFEIGVIPRPEIKKHPDRPGTIATWPDWVLKHCDVIQQFRQKGMTLEEIAKQIGKDWAAIERHYSRYKFGKVSKQMDLTNKLMDLSNECWSAATQMLTRCQDRISPFQEFVSIEKLAEALDMAKRGINPLLVVFDDRADVVSDLAVSQFISTNNVMSKPVLVVPIFETVRKHFDDDGVPEYPTLRPPEYYLDHSDSPPTKHKFKVDQDLKLVIENRGNKSSGVQKSNDE